MPGTRTSFFDEQARRRRHAHWWALFSSLPVFLFVLPLVVPLAPLAYLLLIGASKLIDLVWALPAGWWEHLRAVATLVPRIAGQIDTGGDWGDLPGAVSLVPATLLIAAPGFAAMAALWWAIRSRFLSVGADAILATLGARPPRPDDLEERQLVNVVEEMAIAAGAPTPRVALLDVETPNAAAIGASPDDATLLVTRGALDRFDRDETQALVGHLMGSVINGDLEIGVSTLAVFQTRAVAMLLLNPADWPKAIRVGRWLIPGGRDEPTQVITQLLDEVAPVGDDLASHLVLRPFLMTILRARRYLADATAVQLTRQPDALARVLRIVRGALSVPGGPLFEQLFVVGVDDKELERKEEEQEAEDDELEAGGYPRLPTIEPEPLPPVVRRGEIQRPHPTTVSRLHRVAALGAAVEAADLEGNVTFPREALRSPSGVLQTVLVLGSAAILIGVPIIGMFLLALMVAVFATSVLLWGIGWLLL